MAFLLVILIVLTVIVVALLQGSSGAGSMFGDGLAMAVIIVALGLVAVVVKLMWDDYQSDRVRGGKPRLKLSRKRLMPGIKRGLAALALLVGLLFAYQTLQRPRDNEALATTGQATVDTTAPAGNAGVPPVATATMPATPVATPVVPVPVATPAPPPPVDTGTTEAAVRASLADWAAAWSGRRIDAYLGHYAAAFRAQDGQSRAAWEQQRRQRIGQARDIRVRMDNLTFLSHDGTTAEVRFTQHYRAHNFAETSRKTMRLAREADGTWRILSERADTR